MPGAGEFTIGKDLPIATRLGVSGDKGTYDIQITGPHFGLDAEVASQPIADVHFATKLDFTQKCIGVQWSGGQFVFATGGGLNGSSWPFPLISFSSGSGPWVLSAGVAPKSLSQNSSGDPFTSGGGNEIANEALSYGSADGNHAAGEKAGGNAYVGIHGKADDGSDIYVIGGLRHEGVLVQEVSCDDAQSFGTAHVPFIAYSTDGGASFMDAGIPTDPSNNGVFSIEDIVCPGSPPDFIQFPGTITFYATTDGAVTSLAYDPVGKQFIAGVAYYADLKGSYLKTLVSSNGRSWSVSGEQAAAGPNENDFVWPLPAWPDGAKVNDATIQYPNFPSAGNAPQINANVKYASVNGDGQTMPLPNGKTLGMSGGEFTGISAPGGGAFASAAAGHGCVMVSITNQDKGPTVYISYNGGESFTQVAANLTPPGPGPGTVSFS